MSDTKKRAVPETIDWVQQARNDSSMIRDASLRWSGQAKMLARMNWSDILNDESQYSEAECQWPLDEYQWPGDPDEFAALTWQLILWCDAESNIDPSLLEEFYEKASNIEQPDATLEPLLRRSQRILNRIRALNSLRGWDAAIASGDDAETLKMASDEPDVAEILDVRHPMEIAVLRALNGRAMTKDQLAHEVAGGDSSRLYARKGSKRPGILQKLTDEGRIKNDRVLGGYYRPDSPPPNLVLNGEVLIVRPNVD